MRASLRWQLSDLRAHRAQAALLTLATAVIAITLILSNALLLNATNPWQRVFNQSNGAHLWLHVRPGVDTAPLGRLGGVTGVSGPYRTAPATLVSSADKIPLELRAMGPVLPRVSRPVVDAGRWLDPAVGDGVVLESSLARAAWAAAGGTVTVRTVDGAAHTLRVLGVAETADQGPYPGWTPGLAWVTPATLASLEPDPAATQQSVGLRLQDPAATDFTAQQAVDALGSDQVTRVTTWHQVRAAMDMDNRLLGTMLALFGLAALLATALATAGAAGSRVVAQLGDIRVLKAIGFTSRQVVPALLARHTALAVGGMGLGTLAVTLLGPLLPDPVGQAVSLWQARPDHVDALIGTGTGAVAAIALATALPAWRAGRVAAIPTARAPQHIARLSRAARLALLLRLPAALVLGARAAFHRPLRAAITIVRLAIPIVMITVALGSWATLDGFRAHPQRLGLAAALTATPTGVGDAAARRLLNAQPGVAAVYPGVETQALVPGETTTITLRALGAPGHPYPFAVVQGRNIQGPDEAVAGQGALDVMHVRVGQWVRVAADGNPYILHIVGRSVEPDHNGEMLSVGFDTLSGPTGPPAPEYYALALRPTATPNAVRAAILAASHGHLDVQPTPSPADQLGAVRVVAAGVIVLLALVGLVELLTATGLALRDHARDVAVLRAIGLTPRQITATMATSTGLLALTAAVTGCLVGLAVSNGLINLQGADSGMGAGIAQPPSASALLLTGLLAVTLAATVCALPAARAARTPVARALSAIG